MRTVAIIVASGHLCLVACTSTPGNLLSSTQSTNTPSLLDAPAPATHTPPSGVTTVAAGTPYMRCVTDFWGNCTGVASNRHDYRWRYVRPGKRSKEERESETARASIRTENEKGAVRENTVLREAPPVAEKAALRAPLPRDTAAPAVDKAVIADKAAMRATANTAVREVVAEQTENPARGKEPPRKVAQAPPAREKAAVRERVKETRDTTIICHARRRVVGEERPSQDDARLAAENGWMGAVRYDHGERYQDINRAKDVRLLCGPSSVSTALKQPFFRCAVEATPCRDTEGLRAEPDDHRYETPIRENQISRK